uniref:Uncharacterized protein n=1 Tax=Romanomermis culicivorax TaxID=13658 RepID=A0A915IIU6_ROMCU
MESETAVDRAVQMCHRTIFKGQAIDVKPKTANEEGAGRFRKRPLEDEREPSGPYSQPFDGPPGGDMYNNYGPDLRQEYMHRGPPPMGSIGPRFGNGPPQPHIDGPPRGPHPHFPAGGPPPHPFGAPSNGPSLGSLQPPHNQFMGVGPPPPVDGLIFGGLPQQQQQQGPPPQPLVEDSQAAKRAEYGIERPFDAVIVVTNKNLK